MFFNTGGKRKTVDEEKLDLIKEEQLKS